MLAAFLIYIVCFDLTVIYIYIINLLDMPYYDHQWRQYVDFKTLHSWTGDKSSESVLCSTEGCENCVKLGVCKESVVKDVLKNMQELAKEQIDNHPKLDADTKLEVREWIEEEEIDLK